MNKTSTALVQLILVSSLSVAALASWTADNLDGTYTNPIRYGDYPDNDVIREAAGVTSYVTM